LSGSVFVSLYALAGTKTMQPVKICATSSKVSSVTCKLEPYLPNQHMVSPWQTCCYHGGRVRMAWRLYRSCVGGCVDRRSTGVRRWPSSAPDATLWTGVGTAASGRRQRCRDLPTSAYDRTCSPCTRSSRSLRTDHVPTAVRIILGLQTKTPPTTTAAAAADRRRHWHLSHRRFAPIAHPPLPESSCRVRLRGGGKCRVPCVHLYTMYILISCTVLF